MTPWFPEWSGGVFGGVVGLAGGIYGCTVSFCAPRGLARSAVFGLHFGLMILGVVMLSAAVVAGVVGQPFAVWYSLGLCGLILTILMGAFAPLLRRQYTAAEERLRAARDLTA